MQEDSKVMIDGILQGIKLTLINREKFNMNLIKMIKIIDNWNWFRLIDEGFVKETQPQLRKDSDIFFEQYTQRRNKPDNLAKYIGLK